VSSSVVTVLFVPGSASFTAVTFTVMVRAPVGSRFTARRPLPPSSWNLEAKLA
jgi:hypothetical protein